MQLNHFQGKNIHIMSKSEVSELGKYLKKKSLKVLTKFLHNYSKSHSYENIFKN